jgi:hypothetical protein
MKYKKQWKTKNKTYRFTHLFDNVIRYNFGIINHTDNGIIDSRYGFSKLFFGIYVQND